MALDLPPAMEPGDVLAQPTRARLFTLLGELRRPADTAELAERTGLHISGVRSNLVRLERAGLVQRRRRPQPRGRPRDAWAIAPGARPGGAPPRAYGDLARWLARALPAGDHAPRRDAEAVAREIGGELVREPSRPGREPATLAPALSALGFAPREAPAGPRRRAYRLGNCPYRDAARERPDVVCALHRGMTRGLLDALEPGARLSAFAAHDPDAGRCRVELERATDQSWLSGSSAAPAARRARA